jgi:hypothetical protein
MIAFCLGGRLCNLTSSKVLVHGWIGMLIGPQHPAHYIWLANPILLIAWLLIALAFLKASHEPKSWHEPRPESGLRMAAAVISGLALAVCACFLLPVEIVDNEGGVPVGVTSRKVGYWLWLSSMLCAFASAMLLPAPVGTSSAAQEESSN